MSHRFKLSGFLAIAAGIAIAVPVAISIQPADAATVTTAWQNGSFSLNPSGVVSESDIVLGVANTASSQSLPLGNGSLGVAAWAANGFTAQLNRSDTMPYRLSPGQVNIPGLSTMTSASNFSGTLDLYNGVLDETGGGMSLQAWVPAGKDELIVSVTGANPSTQETATLNLWSGRSPTAAASGAIGSLAQTWVDNSQTGNSGQTFGAMAAITAGGQNVTATVVNSTQVKVTFNPNSDGSFRVIIASPKWTGGNPASTASSLIGGDTTATTSSLLATQSSWWNSYWANSGLIQATSSDGSAQYMENLRTLYLYDEAASMKSGAYPGSQAGVADMFAYDQDQQDWYPAGYWLWNLRGQIAANMSSGNFNNNLPIFSMYLNDLPAIESWTSAQMGGKPGACVPETMRFNGNGYYNGGSASSNASCATASSPTLQRAERRQRCRDRDGHLAAVPGHGQSLVPAAVLPGDAAGRDVPAGVPERRLGRLPARGGQRARDPVGGAGPDRRHRRGPGAVPCGDQRGDVAEHRLLAGRAAAHRREPDRAVSRGSASRTRLSCSTRSQRRRRRPRVPTPGAAT